MDRKLSILFIVSFFFFPFQTVFASNIVINEFLPNPSGSSGEDGEWIELYNSGEQEVDLVGWKVDDSEGGADPYIFPQSTIIAAKEFYVLEKTLSKVALNNTNDAVRLYDASGVLVDSFSYTETTEDHSYGRKTDGSGEWVLFVFPTKNATNAAGTVFSTPTPTTPEPTVTKIPTATKQPSPTQVPSASPTQKIGSVARYQTVPGVAAARTMQTPILIARSATNRASSSAGHDSVQVLGSTTENFAMLFMGVGTVFFAACAILAFKIKRNHDPNI